MVSKELVREIVERVLSRLEDPRSSAGSPPPGPASPPLHPALVLVEPAEGTGNFLQFAEPGQCVMEPNKPCIRSGRCKEFGH